MLLLFIKTTCNQCLQCFIVAAKRCLIFCNIYLPLNWENILPGNCYLDVLSQPTIKTQYFSFSSHFFTESF